MLSSIRKIAVAVLFPGLLLGVAACSSSTTSSSTAGPKANEPKAQTDPKPKEPPVQPVEKPPAKEDLTPPDVKLVKVDFKLKGVDLTIEAPEGAKVDKDDNTFFTEVLFDKDCCLRISPGADVGKETEWWKKGGGFMTAKRYLIEQPDTLLVETDGSDERRFVCLTERDVGGVKYTVGLTRPKSGSKADPSTKVECLLALKCAKTLILKSPTPKPPEK